MAVYIPDLEMPEMCWECPCASVEYHIWACDILKLMLTHDEVYVKRREDCPMVSIPPHGDLIDRDVLHEFQQGQELSNGAYQRYISMPIVEKMKPVIPADWGDK